MADSLPPLAGEGVEYIVPLNNAKLSKRSLDKRSAVQGVKPSGAKRR